MTNHRVVAVAFVALLTLSVVGGVATLGVVSASHGAEDSDYTVEPMNDRSPGAENVKYGQVVVADAGMGLRTVEELKAVFEEGNWVDCGPDSSEVWGIDRGNTHDGYGTDKSLQENTKTFSAGQDVFKAEFYSEEDFGPSTHLDDGDAIVSVAECIDNPDEAGWYQIEGSTSGVTENGERVTVSGQSHYFWICDCENEQEAREKLGRPPSEPEPTPEPESTPTPDPSGEETKSDGGDTTEAASTPTPTETATSTPTPTETATDSGGDETGGSGQGSGSGPESSSSSWDGHVVQTPTPGDGDGFGASVAVVAALVAGLYARRL